MPHHIRQKEAITILVQLFEGIIIPAYHVMGQVKTAEADPLILWHVTF